MKKIIVIFISLVLISMMISGCSSYKNQATNLKISEGFSNPIGFYDSTPTFSWKLPADEAVKSQSAYSIVVASDPKLLPDNADIWQSDIVESDQSIFVKYLGDPLPSRKNVYWQVKYWDQSGMPSEWSEIANFEMGLLNNSDWQAKWIGIAKIDSSDTSKFGTINHKPQYLRKEFDLNSEIKKARLYITAKGVFEVNLNGEKVGNDIMPPGWTPYKKRIEVLTYDVTNNLNSGKNAIGVTVAPGWYSGRIGYKKLMWPLKESPKIICQLEVELNDGSSTIISTDNSWKANNNGPIQFSEIYDGEVYNASLELGDWTNINYSDNSWQNVDVQNIDPNILLMPKRHHPVRNKLELDPQTITEIDEGIIIFDLGQNMVGVPRLNVPMKKDGKLTIRFAEMLNSDGTMYTENYRKALSTDYFYASEDGIINWQPKFTFHGFRYVEISGHDNSKSPDKSWVKGIVQYSDFNINGSFQTSNDKLNQLQSNIIWGLRGNFFDIPTDCPQRDERLGWTGDAQVFAPTSLFNADVHSFWASWLQSMREDQLDNGGIPIIVPNLTEQRISSGWGDACAIIPFETYLRTGDKEILLENYDMMKDWIRYYDSEANDNIVSTSLFGDWLQPFPEKNKRGDTPFDLISTAFYARSIQLTMNTASILGFDEDYKYFKNKFDEVSSTFQNYFFDSNGEIKNNKGTQTGYLLAIGFNLLDGEMEEKAIPHLLQKITDANDHLRTGFLGTPLLAKVLDKIGKFDLMYKILFNETYPSWFYSINQGATTMWERWDSYSHIDGFHKEGMNSFNHYAYGAIGEWMYERIAGIAPLEPGYKKIRIAPVPGNNLNHAKGKYNSPYGEIISEWKIVDNNFMHFVEVPPNTTAVIVLPVNKNERIDVNNKNLENASSIKIIKRDSRATHIEVGAGKYSFNFVYN